MQAGDFSSNKQSKSTKLTLCNFSAQKKYKNKNSNNNKIQNNSSN